MKEILPFRNIIDIGNTNQDISIMPQWLQGRCKDRTLHVVQDDNKMKSLTSFICSRDAL